MGFYEERLESGKITKKQYDFLKKEFEPREKAAYQEKLIKEVSSGAKSEQQAQQQYEQAFGGYEYEAGGTSWYSDIIQKPRTEWTTEQLQRAATETGTIAESARRELERRAADPTARQVYEKVGTGVKVYATPSYFDYLQEKQASKIIKTKDALLPEAGLQQIPVGSRRVAATPTEFVEEIKIGADTYKRVEKAPAGTQYEPMAAKEEPLFVGVSVSSQQAEALKQKERKTQAGQILERASPVERLTYESQTLLSPLGYECIGASILGDRSKVVEKQIEANLKASEFKQDDFVFNFGRGVVDAVQSPVVEVELAALGAAGLATVGTTATGAKILASTGGKAALYGTGGLMLGARGLEIAQEVNLGNIETALGLGVTTVADIGAGLAVFKGAAPKETLYVERTKGLYKLSASGEKITSKAGSLDTYITGLKETKITPLREQFTAKDLNTLGKDWNVVNERINVKVDKIRIGSPSKTKGDFAFLVGEGEKGQPVLLRQIDYTPPKVKLPSLKYVERSIDTGQIQRVGKKVSILRELGLQKKFPEIKETPINFAGARFEASEILGAKTPKGSIAIKKTGSLDILKPYVSEKAPSYEPKLPDVFRGKGKPPSSPKTPELDLKLPELDTKTLGTRAKPAAPVTRVSSKGLAPTLGLGSLSLTAIEPVTRLSSRQKQKPLTAVSPKLQLRTPTLQEIRAPKILGKTATKPLTSTSTGFKLDQAPLVIPKLDTKTISKLSTKTQLDVNLNFREPRTRTPEPTIPIVPFGLPFGGSLGKGSQRVKLTGTKIIKNPIPTLKQVFKEVYV